MNPRPILWIDDAIEPDCPSVWLLRASGFDVDVAGTARRGLQLLGSGHYRGLLLDLALPDLSGLEVLQVLRSQSSPLPVIVVTGNGTVPAAVRATRLGALDVLEKPLVGEALIGAAWQLVARAIYDPVSVLAPLCSSLSAANPLEGQRIIAMSLIGDVPGWFPALVELSRIQRVLEAPDVVLRGLLARLDMWRTLVPAEIDLCQKIESLNPDAWPEAVPILCAECALTVRQLRDMLGNTFGVTSRHLGVTLRLRSALKDLVASNEHVRQVAFAHGYAHASEFNRDVHHLLSVSPTMFRQLATQPAPPPQLSRQHL